MREKAIEVKRIGQKTYPVSLLFLAILEPTFLWLTAAAVRRRAAAITRNFFAATGNFQARVQCFLKLPCFLPQKQGVSGAVATETTMFQGEGSLALRVASRFVKPRGFPVRKMSTRSVQSR